jgi:hypothetical protein
MSDEKEIKKLLLEKDYNLDHTLHAIAAEDRRRNADILYRYEKGDIDGYMYNSLVKRNTEDALAAEAIARKLFENNRVKEQADDIAVMRKQLETLSALLEKERAKNDVNRPISSTQQKALESNVVRKTAKERVDSIPLTPNQKLKKGLDEMRSEYLVAVRGYVRETCYGNASDMDLGDYDLMIHIEERLYELMEQPGWTAAQLHMIQQTINECSDIEDKEWERYRKYG